MNIIGTSEMWVESISLQSVSVKSCIAIFIGALKYKQNLIWGDDFRMTVYMEREELAD